MRKKSPEQVRSFVELAGSRLEQPFAMMQVVLEAGKLALLDETPDSVWVTEYDDVGFELDKETFLKAARTIRSLEHADAAINALSNARAEYETMRPMVRRCLQKKPRFSGAFSEVRILQAGTQRYAVKTAKEELDMMVELLYDMDDVEEFGRFTMVGNACALAQGSDIDGVEKLVAYSAEDGVCVSEYVPGKLVAHMTARDIERVTEQHVERYLYAIRQLVERGLNVDTHPTNLIWNETDGFTVIDYQYMGREQSIHAVVDGFAVSLVSPLKQELRCIFAHEGKRAAAADGCLRRYEEMAADITGARPSRQTMDLVGIGPITRR